MRNDANFDLVLKLINIMIKVVFSIIDCFIKFLAAKRSAEADIKKFLQV